MAASKMIYLKKYNIWVDAKKWAEARQAARDARYKPANPPLRDPKEVKIFEAYLKGTPPNV